MQRSLAAVTASARYEDKVPARNQPSAPGSPGAHVRTLAKMRDADRLAETSPHMRAIRLGCGLPCAPRRALAGRMTSRHAPAVAGEARPASQSRRRPSHRSGWSSVMAWSHALAHSAIRGHPTVTGGQASWPGATPCPAAPSAVPRRAGEMHAPARGVGGRGDMGRRWPALHPPVAASGHAWTHRERDVDVKKGRRGDPSCQDGVRRRGTRRRHAPPFTCRRWSA